MSDTMSAQSMLSSNNWDAQVSLKLLVEAAPIALAIVDWHGQILYVNAKLEELFGYQRTELPGRLIELLLPERLRTVHVAHRVGYMHQPHVRSMGSGMELAGRRKDGSEFPLEAGLSHLMLGDQPVVMATITDISRRKQTEELLERRVEERTREIERRRQVADGLRDILATLNSSHALAEILEFIVAQACWLLAADGCAIYGRDEHTRRLILQASSGLSRTELAHANLIVDHAPLQEGASTVDESGQTRLILPALLSTETAASHMDEPHTRLILPLTVRGEIYGAMLLGYQAPRPFSKEETQLAMSVANQTALAIENARLHTQIEQSAVAAERNRIARDLHDAVTQTLFSASMIADVLPRLWQRNPAEAERRLSELRELTRGALAEMRTLLLELRPSKLVEVEIGDLLRQLAEAIAGRARVAVSVQLEGQPTLPVDVKVALYRIAQEALNNVAKHAQAQRAAIRLHCEPELAELTVSDDGAGFVFERIGPAHLGLGIMRERADAIGATLAIHSQPEQGASVTVRWRKHDAAQ